jgi:adenine-specific DNA-methyltransferase
LSEIRELTENIAPNSEEFCDLFAGTGVVGREFKRSHKLICNDILYFSFVLNAAYNGLKTRPNFSKLSKKIGMDPIDFLNQIPVNTNKISERDFMTISYSPAGDAGRRYLSIENAIKVDRIRQKINDWRDQDLISEPESHYLIASLLEDVPSVSNTTGTYGAFLKHWDARAKKPIQISHLDIAISDQKNQIFNCDANQLIKKISGHVLYIDTPYNGRQYSSNYHLLETLAKYDYPNLKGVTGLRVDDAANSQYCKKNSVYQSFDQLLENADFKTIILSYSSDGLLSENQLIELLTKHGDCKTMNFRKIPYRRYKRTANDERAVIEFMIAINR